MRGAAGLDKVVKVDREAPAARPRKEVRAAGAASGASDAVQAQLPDKDKTARAPMAEDRTRRGKVRKPRTKRALINPVAAKIRTEPAEMARHVTGREIPAASSPEEGSRGAQDKGADFSSFV